ncbi:MAG: pectate lyase [Verrucomicrobiota bacterium]|nr:pectate lyase [Verrucomicrobiota bacterium]
MMRLLLLTTITINLALPHVCAGTAKDFLKKDDAWFATEEAKSVARNILSFQSELGGWPKNVSTTDQSFEGDRKHLRPTYDNGATIDELRFLARVFNATRKPLFQEAFHRGLSYVLEGQYPNGGWPQFHPPGKGYHRHITFNDNAMVRILEFLRELYSEKPDVLVTEEIQSLARNAFDKGIACILMCQIRLNGKRTAWCAQHDANDFRPRSARSYELVSLSGSESVGITRLLMRINAPSPEIISAIESAVEWFQSAKLNDIQLVMIDAPKTPKGRDRIIVRERNAQPLWARFYSLQTLQPMFVDRDGIPRDHLAEIGYERRNGYAWYGTWPQPLIESEYPAWKERLEGN